MIKSFRDSDTELLWNTGKSRRIPPSIRLVASRKLAWLDSATELDQLRIPPANRLEALTGDRKGQHSIRINDQFRLCFKWQNGNAHDVEIVDYH
jgi:proteic killer suppression protein